ncbi:hypothetical protein B0X49_05210, partial [Helicobacter pylori]
PHNPPNPQRRLFKNYRLFFRKLFYFLYLKNALAFFKIDIPIQAMLLKKSQLLQNQFFFIFKNKFKKDLITPHFIAL